MEPAELLFDFPAEFSAPRSQRRRRLSAAGSNALACACLQDMQPVARVCKAAAGALLVSGGQRGGLESQQESESPGRLVQMGQPAETDGCLFCWSRQWKLLSSQQYFHSLVFT